MRPASLSRLLAFLGVLTSSGTCVCSASSSECISGARQQSWECVDTGQGPCPTGVDVRLNGPVIEVHVNGELVHSEYGTAP